jgi:hypothetical protein
MDRKIAIAGIKRNGNLPMIKPCWSPKKFSRPVTPAKAGVQNSLNNPLHRISAFFEAINLGGFYVPA